MIVVESLDGLGGEVVEILVGRSVLNHCTHSAVAISTWFTSHRGEVTVECVRATPGPAQQPRIPIWFGTERTDGSPIIRAARYDGVFPLGVKPDGIRRIRDRVASVRKRIDNFDIAVVARSQTELGPLRDAGATWAMHAFWPGHRPDQILRFIERGVPDG